jgi:hypothetical protein
MIAETAAPARPTTSLLKRCAAIHQKMKPVALVTTVPITRPDAVIAVRRHGVSDFRTLLKIDT